MMDAPKPRLWFCPFCRLLLLPAPTQEPPRHIHRAQPLHPQLGGILREKEPGTRAWRAAGWDDCGNLWGMPCDRQSGANLHKAPRGDPTYQIEIVPVDVARTMQRR